LASTGNKVLSFRNRHLSTTCHFLPDRPLSDSKPEVLCRLYVLPTFATNCIFGPSGLAEDRRLSRNFCIAPAEEGRQGRHGVSETSHSQKTWYIRPIEKEGLMRFAYTAALTLCLLAAPLLAADNPFLGTWKLDAAQSHFSPGPGPKELTVTLEPDDDNIRRVATGTNADGSTIHETSSIHWDGQDHLVTKPTETPRTVAITQVDTRTLQVILKQAGKVTRTIHLVLSEDGKTASQTEQGVNDKGEKVYNVVVAEKQ
jgi:hypothetical protein